MFVTANPAPDVDRTDQVEAASYLATLEQRSSEMTQIETIPETKPPGRNRGPLIAAAVAAVLLIATIGILLANREEAPVVDQPDVVPTTIGEGQAVSAVEAVATADSLLEAYSSGGFDAFMGHFTSAATYQDSFNPPSPVGEAAPMLAWYITQGSQILNPQCSVTEEDKTSAVIECTTGGTLTATEQAANAIAVPTRVTMTITPDGIETLFFTYGNPDFLGAARAFNAWLDVDHPDILAAYYGNWTTVEEAMEHAQTRAQYNAEWAAFGVSTVEGVFADYNAGDLNGFLARFTPTTEILDTAPEDAPAVFGALLAAGDSYTVHRCSTAGASGLSLFIDCDVSTPAGGDPDGESGIELSGEVNLRVRPDETIVSMDTRIDFEPAIEFGQDFKQWLSETYPAVHDQTTWVLDSLPSAADVPTVQPYYAEFIAQSDKYPIGR
jgi:hypothetical protein